MASYWHHWLVSTRTLLAAKSFDTPDSPPRVAAFQLGRLAAYYGLTKEAALERVISDTELNLLLKLDSRTEAWETYREGLLREDGTVVKKRDEK